jgi:hypothetical protein
MLSESLRKIVDKIDVILEGRGHLDHPEDLVFLDGSTGASNALNAIINTSKNPKTITIKWDGYPALIFGRGPNGKFSIMDKHMFNKTDGSGRKIYSTKQFINYDLNRGVDRTGLHKLIQDIWPGLEKETQDKGYYWGDLLFSQPLQPQQGLYKFKANPNGIAYTVDVDSKIGELLSGKTAGIAVHQFLQPNAMSTDEAVALDGTIGNLKNTSNVAIVPSAMPVIPNIKIDNTLIKNVKSSIAKYGTDVDKMINSAPQAKSAFTSLFTTYINKRIVSGDLSNLSNGFMDFINERKLTNSMKNKLNSHFADNQKGILGIFTIWIDLYKLKNQIVEQLAQQAEQSPVKGYLQSGQQSQEGFVSQGLKFVDRMGFSRQNLAGR